jgi:radical SAM superfamily enzyme YgiQ (UPF0313 family)
MQTVNLTKKSDADSSLDTHQNILFINPPTLPLKDLIEGTTSRQIRAFPFGILYLSATLKELGHKGEISCVDYLVIDPDEFRNNFNKTLITEAKKANKGKDPDILAFSLSMSTSWEFFDYSIRVFKEEWPNATLIVGGMHASNTIKHLLANHDGLVDYAIAGQAENAFAQLLSALEQGYTNVDIPGVYYKEKIAFTEAGKALVIPFLDLDVDEIPLPDWDIINLRAYTGEESAGSHLFWDELNVDSKQSYDASLFTSRGCPFHCTFCAAWTIHGRKMRFRAPESVVEEMNILNKEYGVNHFHIYDDLPLLTPKRTHELLSAMKSTDIEDLRISFTQTFYVNTTTEEIIDAVMDYTGIKTISFAVEAGTKEMQKKIRKNVKLEKAERLIRYAQSRGLIVTINIILGFPEETQELMQQTVDLVRDYLHPNWAQYHVATPIVGTTMYDQFVEAGCIEDGPYAWMQTLTNHRYFDSPWISKEGMNEFRYIANLDTNFVHNWDLECGAYDNAYHLFEGVANLYPFQIYAWDGLRRVELARGNVEAAELHTQKIKEMVATNTRAVEHLTKYGHMFPKVVELCKDVKHFEGDGPASSVDPVYGRALGDSGALTQHPCVGETKSPTAAEWREKPIDNSLEQTSVK